MYLNTIQNEPVNPEVVKVEKEFAEFMTKNYDDFFKMQEPISLHGIPAELYRHHVFRKVLRLTYFQGRFDEQKKQIKTKRA